MIVKIPEPRRAQKQRVKLKMSIQGPSGSGKTLGALALAANLWPGAKVCVVDTENETASLYADRFQFDIIPLAAPYTTDHYLAAIDAVVKGGYDVLILDSISHQWEGDGGILSRKEQKDARGGNSFTNWAEFTPEHQRFKEAIVHAPIHLIATMRAKQQYVLETNSKGKQEPRKVGMAAVQREGFDYEFSLAFVLQMDHRAQAGKDRTGIFGNALLDLADPALAADLRAWLDGGAPAPPSAPAPGAPKAEPSFALVDNICRCRILAAEEQKTREAGNPYLLLTLNGAVGDRNQVVCWHRSLFADLLAAQGKPAVVEVKPGKYWAVEKLLELDGEAYRGPLDGLGIGHGDIPGGAA